MGAKLGGVRWGARLRGGVGDTDVGVSSVVAGILGQEGVNQIQKNASIYNLLTCVFLYFKESKERNIHGGGFDCDCGSVSAHLSLAHFKISISMTVPPPPS
jgi:hypothetical protein